MSPCAAYNDNRKILCFFSPALSQKYDNRKHEYCTYNIHTFKRVNHNYLMVTVFCQK